MPIINKNLGDDPEEELLVEIQPSNKKKTWIMFLGLIVILAAVIGVAYYFKIPFQPKANASYQAVFLTNGQVYFGKLYREEDKYAVLKDIYYLQVTQALQPSAEGQQPASNINLVKLGGELHGPSDEMKINRDHILFIEDLSAGSRVLQAIEQLKAGSK